MSDDTIAICSVVMTTLALALEELGLPRTRTAEILEMSGDGQDRPVVRMFCQTIAAALLRPQPFSVIEGGRTPEDNE